MCCHLLQRENVDYHSVKDITSLCEELVKTPALLLVSFKNVCKYWGKQCLKTPTTVFTKLPGESHSTEPQDTKKTQIKKLHGGLNKSGLQRLEYLNA